MAITKIDFPTASTPSYTPTLAGDYNDQNENIEQVVKGYNAISLTNWDGTTTKPQITAGSAIEINGSLWQITTNTDIDTSGASSGTIYIYFDDGTPEFKALDDAPTWSASLNGYYDSGDRFTGHIMEWDGANAYTEKVAKISTKYVTAAPYAAKTITSTSPGAGPVVVTEAFPIGSICAYEFTFTETGAGSGSVDLEIFVGGGWEVFYTSGSISAPVTQETSLSPFVSDGSNVRASITTFNSATIVLKYGHKTPAFDIL